MNIIKLAREAGMEWQLEWQGGFSRVVECATQPELERFAALVRNATLEEAAKCSRDTVTALCGLPDTRRLISLGDDIAENILRMKEQA